MRNWLAGFPLQPGIWALEGLGGSTSLPRVESESWCVPVRQHSAPLEVQGAPGSWVRGPERFSFISPPLLDKSRVSWSLPPPLALIPPGREGTLEVVGDTNFYNQKSLSPVENVTCFPQHEVMCLFPKGPQSPAQSWALCRLATAGKIC